jgi:PKD repeat protein
MKTRHAICFAAALAVACWACTDEVRPVQNTSPLATFDSEQTSFTTTVNVPLTLQAAVAAGERVTSNWYVNGVLESATAEFTYAFPAPGLYTVKYVARNGAGEFSREFEVTVTDVLAIALSTGDSTRVKRKQLDELQLMAIVSSGADVAHRWEIDGVPVSTGAFLHGFMLDAARDYSVTYTGTNAAGSVEKRLVVEATERPLEISFSETDAILSRMIGETLTLTATVLYGGTGIVHNWKVDGAEVSTSATLSYPCATIGEYAITYLGANAINETVTKSYTLRVTESAYLITDCEDLDNTSVKVRFSSTNSPGLTIEPNPYKTGINTSDKVMKDAVAGTSGTSGFFDISLSGIPNLSQYKGLRLKIYRKTGNAYFPHIKFNKGGNNIPPVAMPTKYDEWETIVFMFPAGTAYSAHQLRPLSDQSGNNITTVGDRTILMDDFELIQ